MKLQHVNPEEAVNIHKDVNSRFSVGMHWGTFILTSEPVNDPPIRLKEAMDKLKVEDRTFVTFKHGETQVL